MKSKQATRRALLSSLLSLLLCCSMLLGTTFAWFTDSVTSENNIIKSGSLDVEMWFGETQDAMVNIEEATEKAIFNYQYWEPGYVDLKYIQLKNVGDLAFKYQMRVVPENAVADGMKLAEVIDVYATVVGDNFTAPTRDTVENLTKLGTLKDLMANPNGVDDGVLLPVEGEGSNDVVTPTVEYYTGKVTVCLALKMQEEAGNEYQDLSIGDGFDIQVLATQYTYENDSFDHMYDEWANGDSLTAKVTNLGGNVVSATMGIGGKAKSIYVAPRYAFEPTESYEEAQKSPYRYYHADFVVSADKDVAAESLYLAGYYDAWCQYNDDNWVAMFSTDDIPANTEIRLVEALGATVNYEELCLYGNDGIGFLCGASNQSEANIGTTMTVELRLYETTVDPSNPSGSKNIETGEYIVIGKYIHTFGETPTVVENAEQLAAALTSTDESINVLLADDIDLPISSLGTITAGSGEYKLGGDQTKDITIDLNSKKLNITTTYWSALGAKNADATFTIKNGSMTSSQATGTWNSYDLTFANCNYVIEDVTFGKSVALCNEGKNATLKNVTINETHDYYALWITAEGQTVSIDGLTVNCTGRGIKIDEQYVDAPAKVTLKISDSEFTTASKAAILVKSAAGADVIVDNVDISGVAADSTNAVWVDEDAAAYADLVTVTGAKKIVEP